MKLVPLSALILIAPLAAQDSLGDAGRKQGIGLESAHDGPPPPWKVRHDRFTLEDAGRRSGIGLDEIDHGPPPPQKVRRLAGIALREYLPADYAAPGTGRSLQDAGRRAAVGFDDGYHGPPPPQKVRRHAGTALREPLPADYAAPEGALQDGGRHAGIGTLKEPPIIIDEGPGGEMRVRGTLGEAGQLDRALGGGGAVHGKPGGLQHGGDHSAIVFQQPPIIVDRGPGGGELGTHGTLGDPRVVGDERVGFDDPGMKWWFDYVGSALQIGVEEELLNLAEIARVREVEARDLEPLHSLLRVRMEDAATVRRLKCGLAAEVVALEELALRTRLERRDVADLAERMIDVELDVALSAAELQRADRAAGIDLTQVRQLLERRRRAAGTDPQADDEIGRMAGLLDRAALQGTNLDAVRVELAKSRLRRIALSLAGRRGVVLTQDKVRIAVQLAQRAAGIGMGQ